MQILFAHLFYCLIAIFCTKGELKSKMKRRHNRYETRKRKRELRRIERCKNLGTVDEVFSYNNLFRAGEKCCNGVRWKSSTQRFEPHLLSITAATRDKLINANWEPSRYKHFTISERGKTREIDAPNIKDRQVQKVLTKQVLLPLYKPEMIYNNGASLEGKGLKFSQTMLKDDLHRHYRRYKQEGWIILIDFTKFFPTVSHDEVLKRHTKFISDPAIKEIADTLVKTNTGEYGLPIGVETNQAEMIAFPSSLDNYIKCQLSIKGAGHYMDDYYILVPPDRNPKEILELIREKAQSLKLNLNPSKSRIVSLTKPFKYCKGKYTLTKTGRVIVNGNRDSIKRARRKIKAFAPKIQNGEMSYEDLWAATNSVFASLNQYNDHRRVLRLRRLFYSVYGFSSEKIQYFRAKERLKTGMEYICHRRFKHKALCGMVDIPIGTKLYELNGILMMEDKPVTYVDSENAHLYFARNDDSNGIERGRLTRTIQKSLAKNDEHHQDRWDRIWDDILCQPYRRIEYDDVWLWNDEFYKANIGVLRHIVKLIDIQTEAEICTD